MQQGRWVSYIFRYRDNERCENAGFLKVQRVTHNAGDEARIQIGLKIYKKIACKCMAYLLYKNENDGQVKAVYLDEIPFLQGERDMIMKRVEIPWSNPYGNGRDFSEYDGILFLCDDGERLLGMWGDYDILPGDITVEEKSEKTLEEQDTLLPENMTELEEVFLEPEAVSETEEGLEPKVASETEDELGSEAVSESESETEQDMASEAGDRPEQATASEFPQEQEYAAEMKAESEQETASSASEEDGLSQMLRTYPKIPLFIDSPYLECVKIVPQDIGKLAMSNWRLGENSFLSHGYYHYRYIMLGKVKIKNEEKYVIGVPGVFTNKEKYLANMFGFCLFVPVKNTDYLTGNFGYWLAEISRE